MLSSFIQGRATPASPFCHPLPSAVPQQGELPSGEMDYQPGLPLRVVLFQRLLEIYSQQGRWALAKARLDAMGAVVATMNERWAEFETLIRAMAPGKSVDRGGRPSPAEVMVARSRALLTRVRFDWRPPSSRAEGKPRRFLLMASGDGQLKHNKASEAPAFPFFADGPGDGPR